MTSTNPPFPPAPPMSPLDNPSGANPPVRPTSYTDPTFPPAASVGLPPLPLVPSVPTAPPTSTSNVTTESSTITVTATATIPQPAVAEIRGNALPDGNYEATASGEPPKDAHGMALVRFYVWKYCGTLVMEQAQSGEYVMGLGRLVFCILVSVATWIWGHGGEIPSGMQDMLYVLLGYILGNRGLAVVQQLITAKHGDPYEKRDRH